MAAGEYLVCFSEKCEKEEVKQYFVDCLSRAKFSVTRAEFEGKTLLTVDAPFEILAYKVSFKLNRRWRRTECISYVNLEL